jgi:poly(A) polymerase
VLGRAYKHMLAVRMDQGLIGREAAVEALRAWWVEQPESDSAV